MKLAFLGFGEAGQSFARTLGGTIFAYDIKGAALTLVARDLGVTLGGPELLGRADVVISAVTAAVSLDAVVAVAGHLRAGQVLVDINSVSPRRKQATASLVRASGLFYIDMALMGPVLPAGHKTSVLVAGDVPAIEPWLMDKGFNHELAGPDVGHATAIKMVRSLFVKGLEAITVSALDAAEKSGCHDAVLASLARSFPGLGWPDFADYETERVEKHGARRAAEMRECAVAMGDLGLPEARDLALAVAQVQAAFAKP